MVIEEYTLPAHWACALVNSDTSGLDDEEEAALDAFTEYMVEQYGQCWCLDCDEETWFTRYHDATCYGIGGCDVATFRFDVGKIPF